MAKIQNEYGFQGRLSSDFPSQIIMDITERCNLACIHCPHPEFTKSEHYAGRFLPVELNKKLVDEVKEHGKGTTQYIRYTSNGEPLVHPDAYEMIDYAVRESGVYVTLTTNGTIMKERKTRRLLEAGVNMIDISIDAFKNETYEKVRVRGNLDVTRTNVLNLLKWINEIESPTKVVVSFVEQPQNSDEVKDFEKYWNDQGVDKVVIRRLHSAAGEVTEIADKLRKSNDEARYPCLYPWERVLVNTEGELCFCPTDWSRKSVLANYADTTIKELWSSKVYNDLREAHLKNNFTNHSFCGNCPDWSATRWPWQGKSYANMIEEFIE
ncbi:radical SAM/SPASM domain-containing protein [Sulfuriflexus mobilis]|uniref:radical SAM/SPASM domain-containing protein n=1 Tax=Sulfuriflexus mobilis TaxID=1811807 RepID=UPI0018D58706|nr:radical SAM protein [Sulfuriflexus mobilis]